MGQKVKDNPASYGEREGFSLTIGYLRKRGMKWYCVLCGRVSKTRNFEGECRDGMRHSGAPI
jgi:hypothetical protein